MAVGLLRNRGILVVVGNHARDQHREDGNGGGNVGYG